MTVVTVKICPYDFTDLPSPDLEKAFYDADLAGDGNFSGDSKNAKRVTVTSKHG